MSGLYTTLCSQWLFPLHERIKGHDSVRWRQRLERSQWHSADQIATEQRERLRTFLMDIGARVPYYKALLGRLGLDPRRDDALATLRALPTGCKQDIRDNVDAMKAEGHGPLDRYTTGGSSGEPLIFYIGKARKSHDVAAKWRATRWWDVDVGDPELVVWGSPIEIGAQDRLRRWRDAAMRSHLLPAFEMSSRNLDRFVEVICDTRPAMLFGYPSSLSLIAAHASAIGVDLRKVGVKVVFATSERLYPEQRETIANAFGCQVANGYGARDAGFIAHECPSGNLHLSAEDIVVETLREDGQPAGFDKPGEIVVTHLATADFPIVRYRTGDIGVLTQQVCNCGRGLPLLKEIQGRTTDFVVAADGTVMHGLALIYTLRDLPGVSRFRIEQISLDETLVQVVSGPQFDAAARERIVRDFKARLGDAVHIRVDEVQAIAPEASGKFRYVVSRVKPELAAQRGASDA